MKQSFITAAGVGAVAVLALTSCVEPKHPKGGETVRLVGSTSISAYRSDRSIVQSLYEPDERENVISGKRIRFRTPGKHLRDAVGGPKHRLAFMYSYKNDRVGYAGDDTINVSLFASQVGGNIGADNIRDFDFPLPGVGLSAEGALVATENNCGYDSYGLSHFTKLQLSVIPEARTPAGRVTDYSPTARSIVAGYPTGAKVYEDLSGCGESARNCVVKSSYRGWPMSISLPREHFCNQRRFVLQARAFLDRYVIEETERGEGYAENRWRPVTGTWANEIPTSQLNARVKSDR